MCVIAINSMNAEYVKLCDKDGNNYMHWVV